MESKLKKKLKGTEDYRKNKEDIVFPSDEETLFLR